MEALCRPQTLEPTYKPTDQHRHLRRRQNLKFHTIKRLIRQVIPQHRTPVRGITVMPRLLDNLSCEGL